MELSGLLAILEAWYPGEFGGKAIAQILFGENNPAGGSPSLFLAAWDSCPIFITRTRRESTSMWTNDGQPLFPFGFGLSYTTFRYDHLVAKPPACRSKGDITVTVDVTNIGSREGDEVAQLYVRQK